tara:strand:+ start:2856 stop:3488 length:633 start_codon:yes stop_codon:yes gene_type:complete
MYGIYFATAIHNIERSMNLFEIEKGARDQESGIKDERSGGRGQGAGVICEAGFTMIELVVVLLLMSILIAMAYSTLRTSKEKIACREIYSDMQQKKLQAVSTGVAKTSDVESILNSLEDVDFPNEVNYLSNAPAYEPSGSGWTYQTGGIDFSAGDKTVTFTSKGMTTDNGSVYLYDLDNSSRICAVAVLSTGLVKISTSHDGGASADNWN